MGYKGTFRTINKHINRMERESKQRQRALDKKMIAMRKAEAIEQAAYKVLVYENYVERIQSLHKESAPVIDWESIINTAPPVKLEKRPIHQQQATHNYNNFKPSIFSKALNSSDKKRQALKNKIAEATALDEHQYQQYLAQYEAEFTNWNDQKNLADKLLSNDFSTSLE